MGGSEDRYELGNSQTFQIAPVQNPGQRIGDGFLREEIDAHRIRGGLQRECRRKPYNIIGCVAIEPNVFVNPVALQNRGYACVPIS
jgi:hypothetical protein